nr:low molecular weight phosphotyrosine protein phosphatase [Herpetosiphon sp.]
MVRIVFVCLGNICRSPMAEGVMRHLVAKHGLSHQIEVDSAGTSRYHIGEQPHHGTMRVLRQNGIELHHAARQFTDDDADNFDILVAMDTSNYADMQATIGKTKDVHLMLDFIPNGRKGRDVPDPWYTGNFEHVYDLLVQACEGLLAYVKAEYLK